jgi:hypothetical protein
MRVRSKLDARWRRGAEEDGVQGVLVAAGAHPPRLG